MKNQQKYRLGLDMGTNSLGWAIIGLDDDNEPDRLIHAGVRIFSDGRNVKDNTTLKSLRREARSAQRRRDRYLQRRRWLLKELTVAGLFPTSDEAAKALQVLDPWQLRAQALNKKLEPHQIGRILFHLNQRRGFKSNRKESGDDAETGVVHASVKRLRENLAGKTFGTFLYERHKKQEPVRARRHGAKKTDLYDFYPERSMLEEEFNTIWKAQAEYHPQLLSEELRRHFHKIIFTQRPLKAPQVGYCTYIPEEHRIARALPTFQRYRIYQEVHNLSWNTEYEKHSLIEHPTACDAIVAAMEKPGNKTGTITFTQIRKILKKLNIIDTDVKFNLEDERRKNLEANQVSAKMQDPSRVGEDWHTWSLEKQDQFIEIILDHQYSDEEVVEKLQKEHSLTVEQARCCVRTPLPDGYANLSSKAARYLIEIMKEELCDQTVAVEKTAEKYDEFENPGERRREGELLPELPYYAKAIQGHVVPGTGDRNDPEEKRLGSITNPTVHIALNQIRQVINELISIYGHPYSIAVELSRDLPLGKEQRAELKREYSNNQKTNDRLADIIREQGKKVTADSLLRIHLWEELGKDPCDRRCPFSGKPITISDLFNGNAEIEHLLPFSFSLDNSRANKVICTRQANRDKGNQTPYEAFGHNPAGYNWSEIHDRAQQLPKSRQWRFQKDARERWAKEENNLARHLNDTRYISRLTKEYLENICSYKKIDVLTGRHTALLRRYWGLQNIFSEKTEHEKKDRDDHRHHAVDAITAGMTRLSLLQTISRAAEKYGSDNLEYMDLQYMIDEPWENFRADVKKVSKNIIVSHRPTRTRQGQLHNDTAYGLPILKTEKEPDFEKAMEVVTRKTIEGFVKEPSLIKNIRSVRIRKKLLELFKQGGKESIVQYAQKKGIRKLRIIGKGKKENVKVIPIRDRSGTTYKGYEGDSNWAMEIYQHPETEEWIGIVVSRFEANQKDFQPGVSKRPHPASKLVMRLHRNDYVMITENGEKELMRVQKLSNSITLCPPYEANVDTRNRDTKDLFKYTSKTASSLQKSRARKVHISPMGRMSYGR